MPDNLIGAIVLALLALPLAACVSEPPLRVTQAVERPPAHATGPGFMVAVVTECAHLQPILSDVGESLEAWTRALGLARDAAAYRSVAESAEEAVRRLRAERPTEPALRIRWADATHQGENLATALRALAGAQAKEETARLPAILRAMRRATGGYRLAVAQMEQRCQGARHYLCDRAGATHPACRAR